MTKPSYCNPEGEPDTEVQLAMSARVFAVALGNILKRNTDDGSRVTSGVLVNLPVQPRFPDEPSGSFAAYYDASDDMVHIMQLDDGDIPDGYNPGDFITLDPKPH